ILFLISVVGPAVAPFVVVISTYLYLFFFSSRRRHTRSKRDWSSDVCSSDLPAHRSRSPGGPGDRDRWAGAGARCATTALTCCHQIGRASCRERVKICAGAG